MTDQENSVLFLELGSTGLNRWGTTIQEKLLPNLSGAQAMKVFKEMMDDPIIGALIFAIKMLCRQVEWRVQPGENTPEGRKAAEFLESCMYDMSISWADTVSEILSMVAYGFSVHEIVYKRRLGQDNDPPSAFNDGLIGWRKLPIRAQETIIEWVFDKEGGLQGIKQLSPSSYKTVFIPIEKLLLFRTEATKGNPMGRSLIRSAYRPWYFKKQIEVLEAIGIERDLAGLPIVWVPPNIASPKTDEERSALQKFKDLVTKVKRDQQEGVVMPLVYDERGNKLYDFTLLTSGGRRQFDINAVINRYNMQITQSILADFIMLGATATGTYALSKTKAEIFLTALKTILDSIEATFNNYAVPRLFKVNGWNLRYYPEIRHGDIAKADLEEVASYLLKLAQAGFPLFPNPDLESYLLELANLPGGST